MNPISEHLGPPIVEVGSNESNQFSSNFSNIFGSFTSIESLIMKSNKFQTNFQFDSTPSPCKCCTLMSSNTMSGTQILASKGKCSNKTRNVIK